MAPFDSHSSVWAPLTYGRAAGPHAGSRAVLGNLRNEVLRISEGILGLDKTNSFKRCLGIYVGLFHRLRQY